MDRARAYASAPRTPDVASQELSSRLLLSGPSAFDADFRNSGYARGHFAPAVTRLGPKRRSARRSCFQCGATDRSLNLGLWRRLEIRSGGEQPLPIRSSYSRAQSSRLNPSVSAAPCRRAEHLLQGDHLRSRHSNRATGLPDGKLGALSGLTRPVPGDRRGGGAPDRPEVSLPCELSREALANWRPKGIDFPEVPLRAGQWKGLRSSPHGVPGAQFRPAGRDVRPVTCCDELFGWRREVACSRRFRRQCAPQARTH